MQSRRDHVQAYQFVTARLASALTSGDTGRGEQPMRRPALGAVWGLVIAVLLCGGFAVFGLISPGGATDWRQPGSIVVEKETGNRYLYLNGTLYPTLNTASAMLYFAGGTAPVFRPVSRNSLAGVPHGHAVGIPGAPDALPAATGLLPARWALCAAPGASSTSLRIDLAPTAVPGAIPADARFLVQGDDDAEYVVWRNTSYLVGSRAVLVGLGLGDVPPTRVPMAWIHALRAGPVLAAPVIPGTGQSGPVVSGQPTTIGAVLTTTAGGHTQDYVLRQDGVAAVNPTALQLLEQTPGARPPRPLGASDLAGLPVSRDMSLRNGIPDLLGAPTYRSDRYAVCVQQDSTGGSVHAGVLTAEALSVPIGRSTVRVPAGRGMLAVSEPASPGETDPTYYLITDVGERFAVTQQGAAALGVGGTPVGVPAEVLAVMPAGPDLVTGPSVLAAGAGEGQ